MGAIVGADTDAISAWIASYRVAADSSGPAAITALFTPDADYYPEPYAAPGTAMRASPPGGRPTATGPVTRRSTGSRWR